MAAGLPVARVSAPQPSRTMSRMTDTNAWPRIAVVGAGAVGGYFGARFARAGAPVVMIGRTAFVAAVERQGLRIEGLPEPLEVRVPASSDLSACRDAQLVLFCVKTPDTLATAQALLPQLSENALVVTLQNGVEGAGQIRSLGHLETLAAAVYVALSAPAPGRVHYFGRGDLVVGRQAPRADEFARVCARAAVPCRLTDDIEGELWSKLLMNCALNAISALTQHPYARIVASPPAGALLEAVVDEVVQVARAAGVRMPGLDSAAQALQAVRALVAQMPSQFSSMAQDLARGRRTEIDALNGYVQRRGRELNVPTPANQALFALVSLSQER